jgi:hypothetical protein
MQTCSEKEHGGGEEGRRVFVEEQKDAVLWVSFFNF